jgi:CHAD domain-containing protein
VHVVSVFDPGEVKGDGSMDGVTRLLEDGMPIVTFSELAVEPTEEGGLSVLPDLAGWRQAMPELAPAAGGKLEQALDMLADHPTGASTGEHGIAPCMTMTEAGRLMWRRQLVMMLLNEAGARRGKDSDYVHDMRVATRRARAVARLFGPFFHDKTVRGHVRNLRRTSRALGAVRDLDVALQSLGKYAQLRPSSEQAGLGEIRAIWRLERRQAYRTLSSWLDGADYRAFIAGFDQFCRTTPDARRPASSKNGDGPAPTEVRHVMPSAILQRFEQVRAYEPLVASVGPVPIASLHALRIDCKALRYSLEPVEPLLGDEGGEIILKLKRLQDLLGELNDAAVADLRLAELADVVEPEPLAAFRAHQQAVLAERAAAAPAALFAFVAPDTRRTLAIAISKL